MQVSIKLKLTTLFLCLSGFAALAQQLQSFAVMLERDGNSLPVKIKWNNDPAALSYKIYKRQPGSFLWGTAIATKNTNDSFYVDAAATSGMYEYYVTKELANNFKGHGYLLVNTEVGKPLKPQRILLLVDANYVQPLQAEIMQLIRDYVADGWWVDTMHIQRSLTAVMVKGKIRTWYEKYKTDSVKPQSLYLLGHIPVPYSGAIFPDGHRPDHRGAWPADVYYGVMNEAIWTDSNVDMDSAAQVRNHNFPGDGKFDIDYIYPDTSSLEIGRVDLTNMPAFPDSDTILTKTYLTKAHAFKTNLLIPQRKAVIDDHFGSLNGEAFAANGYRNFSTMIGADSVMTADFLPSVKQNSYLLSYGSGAGTYISAFGVANTPNLVSDSINTVFSMLFGSYFGDWDNENNFLRAPLCSKPMSLVSVWSGRPHWPMHHMSLGYSIGHCARLTQNNMEGKFLQPATLSGYQVNNFPTFIHIALMGDPGLRLFYNPMPENIGATPNTDSTMYSINWDSQPNAVGYEIYLAKNAMQPGQLVASTISNSAQNIKVYKGTNHLYVRAKYVETAASGKFEQLSLGSYISFIGGVNGVGIKEVSPKMYASIYPNPSTRNFTIYGDFDKADVTIYNLNGQLSASYYQVLNGDKIMHELAKGMYIVRITNNDKEAYQKLIIE